MLNGCKLNIFTCCNGVYKDFIPLFALSNLISSPNHTVEVGVDVDDVSETKAIQMLMNEYPGRLTIREVEFEKGKCPGMIRFITEPLTKSDYVYISDVDIITLDKNITQQHIDNIKLNSLNYSNIVRPKSNRLTGLHFTEFDKYYPINDYSHLSHYFPHDENFLYGLMEERHGEPNKEVTWRPVHGIHVSLNRTIDGKPGWGVKRWMDKWRVFRNLEVFKRLEPLLTDMIKDKINQIDNYKG